MHSGVVLSGRYRLDERIATGGMGDVWRATDTVLSRRVAVKVLLPALVSDPDFIARFRAEAQMMAALRHPGIVQVYDSGEDDLDTGGRADYLVMEYVDGEPLSRRITEQGRLGAATTMPLIAQAAQALQAAHLAGIVHRDVKPSNLLVQSDGTVVLVDFGVARSAAATGITSANQVPGTALYMAPEQAAGRPVSGATDIYALGAVAYHCLAGQTPFRGNTSLEVAVKQLQDEPPTLPDDVPAPVAAVIMRALAKDPDERYPSAEAFAEAVRNAAADLPDGGDPVGTPPPGMTTAADDDTDRPSTLTDNPVLVEATAAPDRRRGLAALIGIAAVVAIATAGLAATLAFKHNPGSSVRDRPTPSPTVAPTAEPSASVEDGDQYPPNDWPVVPVESASPTSPTPTASASAEPDPEPTTDPSVDPSPSPDVNEPTAPPPSPSNTEPIDPGAEG